MSRSTWQQLARRGAIAAAVVVGSVGAAPAGAAEATPEARDVTAFACPTDSTPEAGFTDVGENVFEHEIDCLAWYEITAGGPGNLPPTEYGPSLTVTRAQMATFIARFVDHLDDSLMPAYDGDNEFTDVTADNVHVAAINRLADAQIVQGGVGGGPATEYSPNLPVRRDQMASFIARSFNFVFESDICANVADYFDDDDGFLHEPCINALADIGVVQGRAEGIYSPEVSVTRAQMSAYLMRSMDVFVEQELTAPPADEDDPEEEEPPVDEE